MSKNSFLIAFKLLNLIGQNNSRIVKLTKQYRGQQFRFAFEAFSYFFHCIFSHFSPIPFKFYVIHLPEIFLQV